MKLNMLNTQVLTLTRVLPVIGRRRGPGWPEVPEGENVFFLLMGFGFAGPGRDGPVGVEDGNFLVLLIGWRFGRRGVAGAMSKWRRSFASLSVKYRICPGGRVPRFSGPN